MEFENIILEEKNHIALIKFDHPPANTWNLAALEEFDQAIHTVEQDSNIRVLILTGAGEKCFSAGYDVTDSANAPQIGPLARGLWMRIDRFEKPVIAAINGHALGGGLELALACHFRIMADNPKIKVGLTELNLGIIPGWGGTQRLPRLLGRAKALDMIFFSKTVNASEALEIGLVNQISSPEKLMSDAFVLASRLAERPPIAVGCVLRAMAAGDYEGMERGLQVEDEGSARVRETQDSVEGFNAFFEKRKPVFIGE